MKAGRVVGGLLLLQFLGLMVGFILLKDGVTTDYLNVAAGVEGTVRLAGFVLLASAALPLGMAIAALPVVREYSVRTAITLVAVAAVWLVLQAVDNAHILSMLSLSQRYSETAGAGVEAYNLLAAQVRATRGWAHYHVLLVIDIWFLLFYSALFAFRLVPRWVSGIALAGTALHLVGIPLAAFMGYPLIWTMAYALLVSYLTAGIWLVVKGFAAREEL